MFCLSSSPVKGAWFEKNTLTIRTTQNPFVFNNASSLGALQLALLDFPDYSVVVLTFVLLTRVRMVDHASYREAITHVTVH